MVQLHSERGVDFYEHGIIVAYILTLGLTLGPNRAPNQTCDNGTHNSGTFPLTKHKAKLD